MASCAGLWPTGTSCCPRASLRPPPGTTPRSPSSITRRRGGCACSTAPPTSTTSRHAPVPSPAPSEPRPIGLDRPDGPAHSRVLASTHQSTGRIHKEAGMKAAMFHGPHQPLTIEDVDIDKPMGREVLVRTVGSGVCHSDLHFVDGLYPFPTPAILGHEAAGIVEEVGLQVSEFKPGDHVIACLSVFCGHCDYCLTGKTHLCQTRPVRAKTEPPKLSWKGQPVNQFANLSAYAEKMLVHENALVKIDNEMPLDRAALIGCGVTTGVGAVLNTARIEPGSTVAVFGAGGVGLACIQGARIAGARMIIAVDTVDSKLATAKQLEAIGLKIAAEQCFDFIRPGGTATIVGMIPVGQKVELDGPMFLREKKIQGCSMGSNRFKVDMPRYIDLYRQGRLKLDEMITRRGKLEDVNEFFRAMKAGEVSRSVIMF